MTERAKVNRPISAAEIAVVEAMLKHASEPDMPESLRGSLSELRVVGVCGCGCDTVEFEVGPPKEPPGIVADGTGTTPEGGRVGVILWGLDGRLTGLEVYDCGAGEDGLRLPVPGSIRGWKQSLDTE